VPGVLFFQFCNTETISKFSKKIEELDKFSLFFFKKFQNITLFFGVETTTKLIENKITGSLL